MPSFFILLTGPYVGAWTIFKPVLISFLSTALFNWMFIINVPSWMFEITTLSWLRKSVLYNDNQVLSKYHYRVLWVFWEYQYWGQHRVPWTLEHVREQTKIVSWVLAVITSFKHHRQLQYYFLSDHCISAYRELDKKVELWPRVYINCCGGGGGEYRIYFLGSSVFDYFNFISS